VLGLSSPAVSDVFLRVISGNSSFVDYLVYFQEREPTASDVPIFAVEETKTDDSESRNTGVYQRASKFVYIDMHYPGVTSYMLYNLRVSQKSTPSPTGVFGTRCLRTLGVRILGKSEPISSSEPFESVEELISFKNAMRRPPVGNVPILISRPDCTTITISGRLFKSQGLSHDPNIGALSLISACLRRLGWTGRIVVTEHGLEQSHLVPRNKFIQIACHLDVELDGLARPNAVVPGNYWRYEKSGEKLGTIFLHLVVEEFSKGFAIYENHAGCERGYFIGRDGTAIQVSKRLKDEGGVMHKHAEAIALPDLVLIDPQRREVINVEGEKAVNVSAGIAQLEGFSNIETHYIAVHYPDFRILRTVVLYGGSDRSIRQVEVSLLVNDAGQIVLGVRAPSLFRDSIANLFSYWQDIERGS
jgi:hypothetical protein